MTDWPELTLDDLGRIVTGKTPPTSSATHFGGDVPFVTPSDFDGRRLIDTTDRHLTSDGLATVSNSRIPRNAVMVSCIGSDMGKTALTVRDCVTNQQINSIVVRDGVDPLFVYYNLRGRRTEIRSIAAGSAQPILNKSSFGRLKLRLPPLTEQHAIASVLGALDDKIELGRRMNEALETMARAIFEDWFVNFGPVRMKSTGGASYLAPDLWALFPSTLREDERPEGWPITTVETIADRVAMGPFGSNIKVETFVETGIPIISGKHLDNTSVEDSDFNFITEDHAARLASANVYQGDIVFTHAGNIGQVSIIPDTSRYRRYVLSQRQFFLRCNTRKVSPWYMVYFFRSDEGQHKLLANASQVGVPSIARPATNLKAIELCLPDRRLLDAFEDTVRALHLQISTNNAEAGTLDAMRNLLLPQLMAGELVVRDAEKMAGAIL